MKIPNTTLICIDCLNHDAAIRAINICISKTKFDKVLFITDKKPIEKTKNIEFKIIDKIKSREEYSRFMLMHISEYFNTEFALIIQWDGYIVNEDAWDPDFLNYDYIGAKWWHKDGLNVGNGGFSLRSRKLVESIKQLKNINLNDTEDNIICRTFRPELEEKFGIKFADETIADKFAYERGYIPGEKMPWGFHGFFNIHRHVAKNELFNIVNSLPDKSILATEFKELILNLHNAGRHDECIMCCIKLLSISPKEINILQVLYVSTIATKQYWISAMAILQLSVKDPNNIQYKNELIKFKNYY